MKHEQTINHPFHRAHELSLISSNPANPFMCDACGEPVNDFSSYGCGVCNNIHLHMLCALKPLSVRHQSHHHNLALSFSPPYPSKSFTCDICQQIGPNQWLYSCAACEFDAHLSCVTVTTTAPPIQTASSRSPPPPPLTGINQSHNNPLISMQQQQRPHTRPQQSAFHAQFTAGQNQNQYHHPGPGVYGPVRPAATATTLIGQGNLWQQTFGRVVTGASQQLGSSLAQGLLGVVGHGHGGHGGYGGHVGHGGYGGHVGHGGYGGHVGHGGDTWAEGSSSLSYDYDTGRDGGGDLDLYGGGGGGGGTWDGDSSLVSYDYDMGIDGDGCYDDY